MYRIVYQYMYVHIYFLKMLIFIFTSTWKSKQWQTKVNTSDFNGGLMWCRYCNALQQLLVKQNWLMVHLYTLKLTSLFVAIAGWEDGGVTRQQFDRQRLDPLYEGYSHSRAFDWHHTWNRRHSATVLKQPAKRKVRGDRKNEKEAGASK